ncbi:MAG TPA: hypothetical protein VJI46_03435 [Candidatus Nanoarchaeia archaeon]|nr:hypothetical protein [Candidatus Nanoarchaeia archaeon]
MGRKNKPKKISAKKEKYAKFHKEKPATTTLTMPELTAEQQKNKQEAEFQLGRFMRSRPHYSERFVSERKAKSKR